MSNLQYYKTLISDDEVINALVRESKAREGELEKTRVRPNMNFFQRTVSNMVSSNRRITSRQEKKRAEEKEKNVKYRPKKIIGKKRTAKELINEILSSQTKFVQSSIPEDVHFKRMNIVQENVTNSINLIPLDQSDLKINHVSEKSHKIPTNMQFSSYEQVDESIKKKCVTKSPIVLGDDPIQISSDEETTNISSDSGC